MLLVDPLPPASDVNSGQCSENKPNLILVYKIITKQKIRSK